MILTLKELADHLRVNERTILRMLKTGQIQGTKIGGQWRFNGSQVDQIFFPSDPDHPENVPASELTPRHISMPISRLLHDTRTVLDMAASNVEEALRELCQPAVREMLLPDMKTLRERLSAREALLSTGVGHGAALPHPRDPIPTLREPAVLIFGRSRNGVPFNAIDGQPVHIFFLLCCQTIQTHLILMGRLAQLLQSDGFIDGCRDASSPQDVLRITLEAERSTFFSPGAVA